MGSQRDEESGVDRPVADGAGKEPSSMTDRPRAETCRYQVIEELGRGGMGSVERVIDPLDGRVIALKRLRLDGPDAERRAKVTSLFEREYHTLSQLSHPRIIQVFDYGVDATGPYYTMELLDGEDLQKRLPLPWRDMCRIGRDVASSLAILHARRIVHRDVTPGNVRVGDNGYAKLIDFGAMTPMGPVNEVVGTGPFIAPEGLQEGVLDGRADLFALGATLYVGLTGRHAYPARSLAQLRDIWRSPVPALKLLCPEVPDSLNQLVMELLTLSPVARPQSAAVVFERLSAIGGLDRDESLEVAGAYLNTPNLAGRRAVLDRFRGWLLKTIRGRGRSVIVSSEAGMGRSRLLDAVVLEAKLLGALVLRADASDAGEFGVVRRLSRGLVDARPQTRPLDEGLCALVDGAPVVGRRDRLLRALNTWLLESSNDGPLILVIDDLHAIDGPSLAALAALAGGTRQRRLMIVATRTDHASCRSMSALGLLRKNSRQLRLQALDERDSKELLRSVFADADHLDVLSTLLYRHARGNPARTMAATQALLDADQIRYAAGAWELPADAKALQAAMPTDAGLLARISKLGEDAQALSSLLAIDVYDSVRVSDYAVLMGGLEAPRLHRALDELVAARILTPQATNYLFAQDGYRGELASALSGCPRELAHQRLAAWYEAQGRATAAAHHASCAGDWEHTLRLIQAHCGSADVPEAWEFAPTAVATFERLIAHYDAHDPAQGGLLRLRCTYIELCAQRDEWARVVEHMPAALADLSDRCGLPDYAQLSDLPDADRLSAAIAQTEARYAGTDGAMPLLDALAALPRAVVTAASVAVVAVRLDLAESLPDLTPLYPLSPAYPIIGRLTEAIVACARGLFDRARAGCHQVHVQLQDPAIGLPDSTVRGLSRFSLGFVQSIEASMGLAVVLTRADPDDGRNPKMIARERLMYYLAIGDIELANTTRRELERLEVEGGAHRTYPTHWQAAYSVHSLTGNLEGLKRCEREALQVSEQLPDWKVRVELARIAQELCGTITEGTLLRAKAVCAQTARDTVDHRYAMFLRFEALFGLDRDEECRVLMQTCVDGLGRPCAWYDGYEAFLARAEARLGMHDSAREHGHRHVAMFEASGVRGVFIGRTYEELARVGLLIGDAELFRTCAERCAEEYRCGHNPALTARYECLIREASEQDVSVPGGLADAATFSDRAPAAELFAQFGTQLSSCVNTEDRLQGVLSLAIERSGASAGFLYLTGPLGLSLAAIQGVPAAPEGLDAEAKLYWQSETEQDDLVTATSFDLGAETEDRPTLTLDGLRLSPIVLSDGDPRLPRGCGVLILATTSNDPLPIDLHVTAALTQLILEDGGVTSVLLA